MANVTDGMVVYPKVINVAIQAELVGMSFSWQLGVGYYLPVKAPLGLGCLDEI